MTDDIVEELRNSDGFKVFRAGDGHNAIAADTDLMGRAADEIERLRAANEDLDMVASLREQEIERLRTALQKIYNIWDGTGYADLCEGACGNLMFGVAQSALEGTP